MTPHVIAFLTIEFTILREFKLILCPNLRFFNRIEGIVTLFGLTISTQLDRIALNLNQWKNPVNMPPFWYIDRMFGITV